MSRQLMPVARSTEQLRVRVKPADRAMLDLIAEARGEYLSELIRLWVLEEAQRVFLVDVLQPVLHSAFVEGPASRAGSINPGGKHETRTKDRQKMASLKLWIDGAPLQWRTAQGSLLPSERKSRTELLEEYGGDALKDWLGTRNPPVSLGDFCEAVGYMDRLTFATELLNYKPPVKRDI
jgi:hypothetical protein